MLQDTPLYPSLALSIILHTMGPTIPPSSTFPIPDACVPGTRTTGVWAGRGEDDVPMLPRGTDWASSSGSMVPERSGALADISVISLERAEMIGNVEGM